VHFDKSIGQFYQASWQSVSVSELFS